MQKRRVIMAVAAAVTLGVGAVVTAVSANASQGAFVEIANSVSGKCADVADASLSPGAYVHQWDCHNDANQLWYPDDQGNGFARFVNKNSGLCLTMWVTASVVDSFIVQDTCGNGFPQQWRWAEADDSGHTVLQARLVNLGSYCLALYGVYSARNGWPIVLHDCATTSGQLWYPR